MGRHTSLKNSVGRPCAYCGVPLSDKRKWKTALSRDHLLPQSRFVVIDRVRPTESRMVFFVCQGCNNDKGNLMPEDWLVKLQASGDRRAERFGALLAHWNEHIRPELEIHDRGHYLQEIRKCSSPSLPSLGPSSGSSLADVWPSSTRSSDSGS